MLESINKFQISFNKWEILMFDGQLNTAIHKFRCFLIKDNLTNGINNEFKEIKKEENILIIGKIDKSRDHYFVIIFDQKIIFIPESNIKLLFNFLSSINNLIIFTISDNINTLLTKNLQDKIRKYHNLEKSEYIENIHLFTTNLQTKKINDLKVKEIWDFIRPILSSYFISIAFEKLRNERKKIEVKRKVKINENYIILKDLGIGCSSTVKLIYHLEMKELFVLKIYDQKQDIKSYTRETNFYKNNCHPSIPFFYGETKFNNFNCIIIEYIIADTLFQIKKKSIINSKMNKYNIFLQIMIIVEFFQFKNYIFRDLKPDNILMDQNNKIFFIDFDQVINKNEIKTAKNITQDFNSIYVAPELQGAGIETYTFKEDIYSIGRLMEYIYDASNSLYYDFQYILNTINKCTSINPHERPNITELINSFYEYIIYKKIEDIENDIINEDFPQWMDIDTNNELEHDDKKYYLYHYLNERRRGGIIIFYKLDLRLKYHPKDYFLQNLNIFINYLLFLTKENQITNQSVFEFIYKKVFLITGDFGKVFQYFTLDNNKENPCIQFFLGNIYLKGSFLSIDDGPTRYFFYTSHSFKNYMIDTDSFNYGEKLNIEKDEEKAIYYYTKAADQNHSVAQRDLGYYYINRNINKAVYYLTLASNQNDSFAQYYLGEIYFKGQYIQKDINKSIYYFKQSNHPYACKILGNIYYYGIYAHRDINLAMKYLNSGGIFSEYDLGVIYYEGKYIKRDIDKAIEIFTFLTSFNYPEAHYKLGEIFYDGLYVVRNIEKSIYHFLSASKRNHSDSQYRLGLIYYEGKDIKRDINKAIYYFSLAAKNQHSKSQYYLGTIFYEGKYVEKNIDNAIQYFTLASNKNDPNALFTFGIIYCEGKYVKQDMKKALKYFRLAANQNFADAQCILGIIYLGNKFFEKNINISIDYLHLSANNHHPEAQFILGTVYLCEEKYRDISKSIFYYKESSSFNFSRAKNNLAIIYCNSNYDCIGYSIELLEEAVRLKDYLSMYNLSHIFFYYEIENKYDIIIDMLIKLLLLYLSPCSNKYLILLCLVLIKKHKNITLETIENEFKHHINQEIDLINIYNLIYKLFNTIKFIYSQNSFDQIYEKNKDCYLIYDALQNPIQLNDIKNNKKVQKGNNITNDFYEGFGIDI